jgi:hypothetical protein
MDGRLLVTRLPLAEQPPGDEALGE